MKTDLIEHHPIERILLLGICLMDDLCPSSESRQKKSFLFLQSVSSPFFKHLACRLEKDGHRVHKVSFNCGDVAYWAPRSSRWFRSALLDLPDFLTRTYRQLDITDQVVFGDRRPIHQVAIKSAQAQGVRNQVFEEGYFRPYWITLEREGVNARSQLPKDPDWYCRVGEKMLAAHTQLPAAQSFESPFWRRAAHDVAYHTAGALNPLLFPVYRTHALSWAPSEYVGYVRRQIQFRLNKSPTRHSFNDWLAHVRRGRDLYFLPLQLDTDFQVRDQRVLNSMTSLLEHVVASFARHAPSATCLLVKNHPLDDGRVSYTKILARLVKQYELADRVRYCETGDLDHILACARGTVVLNSTVGSVALERGCPTLCLTDALYRLPGLTAECGLNDFWTQLPAPDPLLFAYFKTVVMHTTQINGGFYCSRGMALAAQGSARVLGADRSQLAPWLDQ